MLGVAASVPLGDGAPVRVGLRGADAEPQPLASALGLLVAEAQPLGEKDAEGEGEALTQYVAVMEREREGCAVSVGESEPLPEAEGLALPDAEASTLALGDGAPLALGNAEGDAEVVIVGVTLVQMSTITTEPSAPAPFARPPPLALAGPPATAA